MVTIEGHEFEGWYSSVDKLKEKEGVYVVVCVEKGKFRIVDVGQSDKVRNRIETHDRKDCWEQNCKSENTRFGVLYTSGLTDDERREIEGKIRANRPNMPCGKE